jgi:hypothetical protein
MTKISDQMADRLIRITRKYGLDYGKNYDALYLFVATLTLHQQDEITKALLRK